MQSVLTKEPHYTLLQISCGKQSSSKEESIVLIPHLIKIEHTSVALLLTARKTFSACRRKKTQTDNVFCQESQMIY